MKNTPLTHIKRRRVTYPVIEIDEKFATQQQFKNDCDINTVVRNALKTGTAPGAYGQPAYGDFSETPKNLNEAYDLVAKAEETFMTLPAELRLELNNDAANLGYITHAQAAKYGLNSTLQAIPPAASSPPPQAGGQTATPPTESEKPTK